MKKYIVSSHNKIAKVCDTRSSSVTRQLRPAPHGPLRSETRQHLDNIWRRTPVPRSSFCTLVRLHMLEVWSIFSV